jgi:hypothetical protein
MTHAEQFAINEWLSDYPEDKTYAEIIDMMKDDDEDGLIGVWQTVESYPLHQVADFIDNTRHHFQCTVETMKQEGVFA